jgi:hypothetical protein
MVDMGGGGGTWTPSRARTAARWQSGHWHRPRKRLQPCFAGFLELDHFLVLFAGFSLVLRDRVAGTFGDATGGV